MSEYIMSKRVLCVRYYEKESIMSKGIISKVIL